MEKGTKIQAWHFEGYEPATVTRTRETKRGTKVYFTWDNLPGGAGFILGRGSKVLYTVK
ncbi:MAG: hypothetical protein GY851_29030 [bacterium]|nr:hypothetical protein [bacterium]